MVLDLQGLHQRLEEGNLDPKEVEIARAGYVCGKDVGDWVSRGMGRSG